MAAPHMQPTKLGKYRLGDKLGQGAMGEVFRAHDPVLDRDVAIKTMKGRISEDEDARHRFLREARAAAQLNHPNIITVHDFGEEGGVAYMAMELLEGNDLRELIEHGKINSLEEKLAIMRQVLDGLAFAHGKGMVHRDLKPGNVHVLPSGQVKIVDFGLALQQDKAATGVIMGTPYYMAPEQAQGVPTTASSDVFSAGALFYELLAGRRPFTGLTIPAVLYAVAHKEPEPLSRVAPPDVPAALEPFVMRALAKSAVARYADAGEMRQALHAVETEGDVEAREVLRALGAALAGEGEPVATGVGYGVLDSTPAVPLGAPLSARKDLPPELAAALEEIEQYFADRVPPLMAADSVQVFMAVAPQDAAAEIWAWGERQLSHEVLPIVDLLFHALHKLGVIGEFDLVDRDRLIPWLRQVGEILALASPPGERDRLRRGLRHLGESEMVRSGPIDTVRHLAEPPAMVPVSTVAARTPGLARLSLLEQRLRRSALAPGVVAEAVQRRVASQAISIAATEARSERELEDNLRRLRSAGVASAADQVFRSLGREIADWAIPKEMADTADVEPLREVQAMKQIVALAEDPIEAARRYRHLVTAAQEQFNAGNLGGAVEMFGLAERLAAEKKVDPGYTEPLQKKGHEALDEKRLRQFMEKPDRHAQLQSVMAFYETGLGPATLLDELEGEERRERRRLLLDLLVVHGDRARCLAGQRLQASLQGPASDFARRNWIYLLRLLPRPAGEPLEPEANVVARFAAPGHPGFLVKEALLHLTQLRHPSAAAGLVSLLEEWEGEAERDDLEAAAHEETLGTLDRVAAAIARQGNPSAWAALVGHALSRRQELGDTVARLGELGAQDLSSSPEIVQALTEDVRAGLPRGVLKRLVGRASQDLPALVGALAGTRSPQVRALLAEVARRHAAQPAGRAAAKALETPSPVPAATGLSGELERFGLPALLQRLAQGRSTGTLHLLPDAGALPAAIDLAQGRLVNARWGVRAGLDALYQLFERPVHGSWAFDPSAAPAPAAAAVLGEPGAIVREGVRRARELQRTSAVVPEDVPLEATGTPPGSIADEADYELIVALWQKACAGVPAGRIEAELTADAFRLYRPLAQWLEEGALRPAGTPAPAPELAPAEAPAEVPTAAPAATSAQEPAVAPPEAGAAAEQPTPEPAAAEPEPTAPESATSG